MEPKRGLERGTARDRPSRSILLGGGLLAIAAVLGGLLLLAQGGGGPVASPPPSTAPAAASSQSTVGASPSTATSAPTASTPSLVPWRQLDERWGTYLSEREWGNPREARNGDGWGLFYHLAGRTDYRFGEDGIAGLSDDRGEFDLGWAFWDGRQPYVTERYYGLSNFEGPHGEGIHERRTFQENSPTHAYSREDYEYPYDQPAVDVEMESARVDDGSLVLRATVKNLTSGPTSIHLVLKGWLPIGETVERTADGLLLHGSSSEVAIALDGHPTSWQVSDRKAALDSDLRAGGLRDRGPGHIGALDVQLDLMAGGTTTVRAAVAEAGGTDSAAGMRAETTADSILGGVDAIVAARQHEADALFRGDVAQHRDVYRQALMGLLWSESYYRWDGANAVGVSGPIDAHDVLIMPDKWEYPWPASWDGAFQAVSASLVSQRLGEAQLRFLLSNRWQQPDGHVPCAEWVMSDECPPLLAWSAWRVASASKPVDVAFLRELYPALRREYAYWQTTLSVPGQRGLFRGGFLGMDNLPRASGEAQVDGSAWMAMFAGDLARIAQAVGDGAAAKGYLADRAAIAAAVNGRLWDETSGFYYDLGADGKSFLRVRSYAGLVPLIAGIVPADRLPRVLAAIEDPRGFLSAGGIRSVAADDPRYVPGYVARVNSNWLGPVWMPINYLLVEALRTVDPPFAAELRDRLVGVVERDWQSTGHFHEYFDGDSGAGLGADAQTGWTALVANLIAEGWPAR